ncbi:hypothetical protein XH92_24580 [Bradyrhizobium sp. CCBAU 53421]|nr:hypothetical protein XH92_24580 [Bradyrhizobium sp. CCBAU 53421]
MLQEHARNFPERLFNVVASSTRRISRVRAIRVSSDSNFVGTALTAGNRGSLAARLIFLECRLGPLAEHTLIYVSRSTSNLHDSSASEIIRSILP